MRCNLNRRIEFEQIWKYPGRSPRGVPVDFPYLKELEGSTSSAKSILCQSCNVCVEMRHRRCSMSPCQWSGYHYVSLLLSSFVFLSRRQVMPYFMITSRPPHESRKSNASVVYAQPWPIASVIGRMAAEAAAPRRHRTTLDAAVAEEA